MRGQVPATSGGSNKALCVDKPFKKKKSHEFKLFELFMEQIPVTKLIKIKPITYPYERLPS